MAVIKKWLLVLLICLLLFSLIGCENNKTSALDKEVQIDNPSALAVLFNPPTLKVSYQDKSIDAKRGTYSWHIENDDGTRTGIEADAVAPPELVKNETPLSAPPKASLTLSFSDTPSDVTVDIWKDNEPIKQSLVGGKIVVPELNGTVVYEVTGKWEQGTVYYAFSVEVE